MKFKLKINIKVIIVVIILVLTAVFFGLYNFNYAFRKKVNNIITFKYQNDTNVPMIALGEENINAMIGFGDYFAILKQNALTGYTETKEEFSVNIAVANPVYDEEGKYLVIAEENSNKFYVFNGKNLVYEKEVVGTISGLTINKNGYVAVCVNRNGYRSVITVYDASSKELFVTFLATTYASAMRISPNNKKLAIVEIDTSGIQISSSIKFVQIDKIKEENNIVNTEKLDGVVISNMEFANNSTVIFLENSMVRQVNLSGEMTDILDLSDTSITNIDISLGNYIVRSEKTTSNVFDSTNDIVIVDRNNKEVGRYSIEGTIKSISVKNNVIAASIGQEVYFITVTGRPIKKYVTNADVKSIILYNNSNVAALIYRNKIEIIYI